MNIKQFLELMNYNLSRSVRGKSELGKIQNELIDLFFKQGKSNEQIASFKANLFSNPECFSSNIDYTSIKDVSIHFDKKLEQYRSYESSKTI